MQVFSRRGPIIGACIQQKGQVDMQSDQSSLGGLTAGNGSFDQTVLMCRLICIFVIRTYQPVPYARYQLIPN